MSLSARFAPDSQAASLFHRSLLLIQARRLARSAHPRASMLSRVCAGAALERFGAREREWITRVEERRADLPSEMVAEGLEFGFAWDGGGGSDSTERGSDAAPVVAPEPPDPARELRRAWEVCRWVSIPPVWGRFLLGLVRALGPRTALELGTGLGLSGAYQAAGMELAGDGTLTTLDFHDAGRIAEQGFADLGLGHRIELAVGDIDETLPPFLDRAGEVHYALLDAEHSLAATTRHFDLLLPHLADGAVVVFDDVIQTEEMRAAWRTVLSRSSVTLALPLRRVGVVVIGPGTR
jgi:predicted O-methyltransferase YrrM